MRHPPIELIIAILALFTLEQSSARRARGLTRLPVPTSETIPYVAEVMGAASYEETVEDEEPSPVKRVQRKLTNPEDTDRDLDPEQQEFAEYQGVMGRPGVDFPVLPSIPRTDFSCRKVKSSGYYADLETGCQVFHICDGGRKISFLCPNGTIFRQSHLICDWWFRVDCERSVELYEESAEQLAHDQMIYKKRAEEIAKAMESKPQSTTERISNFRSNRRKNEQNFNNFNGKEQNYTSQASNQESYRNTNRNSYQTNRIQTEKEGQVLAETASFASNRHRFGNQINQNYYQTSTKAPNAEGQNYQGNFQTQQTNTQRYSTAASVQSTTLNRNNYNFNDFNKVNQYQTTARAQQNINTQYQTTAKPQYQQNYNQYQSTSAPQYQTTAKVQYQQNYNQYQSTSAPQYQTPSSTQGATRNFNRQTSTFQPTNKPTVSTANQPIFNVKVKPNKQYSFVELHRQNGQTTASVEATTTQYSSGPSTTYSPTVPHGSTQFAYIPSTPSTTTRYATYNSSGKTEEIRPEIVNSMIASGVTPTSAKALHSLASYISSAEVSDYSGESNRPQVSDVILNFNSGSTDTPTTVSPTEENLPSVLTKQTKDSYEYLFSDSKEQMDKSDLTPKETGSILGEKPKSTTESSTESKVVKTTKDDKNLKLRDSSELRELAQVFSRALSAYLEDPDTFKEILAQVRPTEPNLVDNSTPSPDDEVLDFSDGSQSRIGTTEPPGTTASDIGEINNLASNKNIDDNSVEYTPDQSGDVFTTVAPENGTDYYSKQGSAEDQSYFPTAGGVADSSRPRYGGFHNNTRNKYSPYGADVPKNTTGTPLAVSITTPIPITTFGARLTNVPEPQSVNSLANNVYNTGFTSSGEESYEANGSAEEKLLIASGSQSLVSSNNYVKFAEDFNKRNGYTKDTSATGSEVKDEEYLPYFGQEPPLENLAAPAAFQTQNPVFNETKDSEYRVSYKDVNLGNGVTLEKEVYTTNPVSFESTQYVSDYTTVGFSPTTYHPTVETAAITTEPATIQTETTPYYITTMKPDHPEYNAFMESKAKEMFGNLNESTVEALMEMMSQAESNMTIRRLVLLLASDKGKEYKTAAESRQSLINALLTDSSPEMTTPLPPKRKVKTGKAKDTRTGKSYRGTETATGNHGVQSAELANKLNSAKLYIPTTATTTTTTTTESKLPYDSDARAVELLKTLYNLAAKWG